MFLAAICQCNIHRMFFLGMPIQSMTDCGLETTLMYGLATALRFETLL